MTPKEYIELAARTKTTNYDAIRERMTDENIDLLHAALGMCCEYMEWLQAKTKANREEELGDLCWYASIAMRILGGSPAGFRKTLRTRTGLKRELLSEVESFASAVKALLFYGREIDAGDASDPLMVFSDIATSKICNKNIKKLKQRYPDKFAEDKAINRDVEKEYEAMR